MSERNDRLNKAILMNQDNSFQKLVEVMDPGQPGYKKDGLIDYYVIRLGNQKSINSKHPNISGAR